MGIQVFMAAPFTMEEVGAEGLVAIVVLAAPEETTTARNQKLQAALAGTGLAVAVVVAEVALANSTTDTSQTNMPVREVVVAAV